jgi:hypothetical protein
MGNATMRALQFDPKKSVNAARNILFQSSFLQDVIKKLEQNPSSVIAELNEFRAACKKKKI